MKVTLEYIWLDGTIPTAKLRSKTKIISADIRRYDGPSSYFGKVPRLLEEKDQDIIPVWGFDGSSTNQATGDSSDCSLIPVKLYQDPFRENGFLVLCEVYNVDGTPHITNTRYNLVKTFEIHKDTEPMFGIEQEYTFFEGSKPLGFPNGGYPAPQGHYYCGIGADEVFGRNIVEEHMKYCLNIGIMFEGINAEVMPGQWEFQIGAGDPISVSDDLWIARYLLYRTAEKYSINATLEPKPVRGDWNGAGAHTNFSTKEMRKNYDAIELAVDKLSKKHPEHIEIYGEDNHLRLTGKHETCSIEQFRSGVSNRGASIRIPWHVSKERKGYIEDRRPAANMDPYLVTRKIIETVCE